MIVLNKMVLNSFISFVFKIIILNKKYDGITNIAGKYAYLKNTIIQVNRHAPIKYRDLVLSEKNLTRKMDDIKNNVRHIKSVWALAA